MKVVCDSSTLIALARAKERGTIEQVKPLLDELKQKGFFLSEDLYRHVIQKAGEQAKICIAP